MVFSDLLQDSSLPLVQRGTYSLILPSEAGTDQAASGTAEPPRDQKALRMRHEWPILGGALQCVVIALSRVSGTIKRCVLRPVSGGSARTHGRGARPARGAAYGMWHKRGTQQIVKLARRGADPAEIDALAAQAGDSASLMECLLYLRQTLRRIRSPC